MDFFTRTAHADTATSVAPEEQTNSQKMDIAEPNIGPDSSSTSNTDLLDVTISNNTLTPKVGPLGSNLDVADIPEGGGQISIYTVHTGDTIASVAQMFNVSKATIVDANDLTKGQALKEGMILAIPPVSGRIYTIKDGDTVASVAKKYKVDPVDIAVYNDLDINSDLVAGNTLIIPDSNFTDTVTATSSSKIIKKPIKNNTSSGNNSNNNSSQNDKYLGPLTAHPMRVNIRINLGNAILRPIPISESVETQGAHGYGGGAVDLGAKIGTPIHAAADGTVVLARDGGWNSGYGKYIIIMSEIDGNVVQTIYAHESKILTSVGAQVHRGDIIGEVGRTGNATGPHLHFEMHGAINPLTFDPNYTGE